MGKVRTKDMTKKDKVNGDGEAPDPMVEEASEASASPEAESTAGPEAEVDEEILQEIEHFLREGIEEKAEARTEDEGGEESAPEKGDPLEEVQADLTRLRDQHLRLAADFENYRKRASAELTGNWVRARADLVRSLVEGLDDLQRVSRFTSEDTTVEALIEGVDLVERNILKALTDAGLEVLDPEGEQFDPNTMEAMMRVPTEEDGLDEIVHQVFQKGYMFKDQLVRPARVSVYKDDD